MAPQRGGRARSKCVPLCLRAFLFIQFSRWAMLRTLNPHFQRHRRSVPVEHLCTPEFDNTCEPREHVAPGAAELRRLVRSPQPRTPVAEDIGHVPLLSLS